MSCYDLPKTMEERLFTIDYLPEAIEDFILSELPTVQTLHDPITGTHSDEFADYFRDTLETLVFDNRLANWWRWLDQHDELKRGLFSIEEPRATGLTDDAVTLVYHVIADAYVARAEQTEIDTGRVPKEGRDTLVKSFISAAKALEDTLTGIDDWQAREAVGNAIAEVTKLECYSKRKPWHMFAVKSWQKWARHFPRNVGTSRLAVLTEVLSGKTFTVDDIKQAVKKRG